MSTRTAHSPLKNEEDAQKFKEEMSSLGGQPTSVLVALEEAQRIVGGSTKGIEQLKWCITPIGLLPSELLSSIFELCALDDWRSPLRLACVSHHLRNIILNTPKAWCSVLVDDRKEMGELYFERSGQYQLHVGSSVQITFPVEVVRRIKCMTAKNLDIKDISVSFSSLERLCIQEIDQSLSLSDITTTSFPLLRHLDLSDPRNHYEILDLSLPPLESLRLCADEVWFPLVRGCSASLTSLYLFVIDRAFVEQPVRIDLPVLHDLMIEYCHYSVPGLSWLEVNAPSLRVYIDCCDDPDSRCLFTSGWQSITHLRISDAPSLFGLRDVRVIQLILPTIYHYYDFLLELGASEVVLHHLENVEFSDYSVMADVDGWIQDMIDQWESFNYPGLKPSVVSEPWVEQTPWNPSASCEIHMHFDPYRTGL